MNIKVTHYYSNSYMSEILHYIMTSFELSKRLDEVFGDEDVVKCRRALLSCCNNQLGADDCFRHYIGSMCDGYYSTYSDIDIMYVINNIYMYDEDTSCVKHNRNAPLLAVTSQRSSYVQIQLK